MDTSRQLHEHSATGWQRGVYDDIKHTFRAPIVNWIFRTTMANDPEFLRYAWGQVKPVFETRAFARLTVTYRDAVLSALDVSTYRRVDVGVSPSAYRELRGQVATYDVVAPRLAVFFEVMDRGLHDDLSPAAADDRASTAPCPADLDRDRGLSPTLLDEMPSDLAATTERIRDFHGLGPQMPSIYRTLAQWPSYLERAWADLEPTFEGSGFDEALEAVEGHVADFVDAVPYDPRLAPGDLAPRFDDSTVDDLQSTFREFNTGPVETVLPVLPAFAATVDEAGPRTLG